MDSINDDKDKNYEGEDDLNEGVIKDNEKTESEELYQSEEIQDVAIENNEVNISEESSDNIVTSDLITPELAKQEGNEPKIPDKKESGKFKTLLVNAINKVKVKSKELFLRYKLPVIIAAAVIVVGIASLITVLVLNRDLVRISSAEDFLLKSTEGKTTYVITKNITVEGNLEIPDGMSIDLNKKTLTINGSVIYNYSGESDINIGHRKRSGYVEGGKLITTSLMIDAPNAAFNVYSPVEGNALIVSKSALLGGGFVATNAITIEAENLIIKGDITANSLNIINASESIIHDNVSAKVYLTSSSLIVYGAVDSIIADDESAVDVYGTISNSITGGGLVIMRSLSSASKIIDSIMLNIYPNAEVNEIEGIDESNIKFFVVLDSPYDITINQEGGAIMMYISEVYRADEYVIKINDTEFVSPSKVVNITQYINAAGTYTVEVYARSSNELFLDSLSYSIEYSYSVRLATPVIFIDDIDGFKIMFNPVPFATAYRYSVNGEEYTTFTDFTEGEQAAIDITAKITSAGVYVVKVQAFGESDDVYQPSETAARSFVRRITLSRPKYQGAELTTEFNPANKKITLKWDKTDKADYYSIYVDDVLYVKTRAAQYVWNLGDLGDGATIKVIADGYSYYNSSPASFTTYNFAQLGAVNLNGSVTGDNIELSWNAVPYAESYSVYLEGIEVISGITGTSFTIDHILANSGAYQVRAYSEYYKVSESNTVTINAPQLDAPVLSYDGAKLEWEAVPGASDYKLYRDGTLIVTTPLLDYSTSVVGDYYLIAISGDYLDSDPSNTITI